MRRAVVSLAIAAGAVAAAAPTLAADRLPVTPMQGPHADLAAVCTPCTTTARLDHPGAPLREVRVVVSGDPAAAPTPSNQQRHWLAIRTDAGWFIEELGFSGVICGGRAPSFVSRSASGLVAHDLLGDAAPEVELDVDVDVIGGGPQIIDRIHHVCGIGPSGVPGCTSLQVRRRAGHVADSWEYQVTISRRGAVHMTEIDEPGRPAIDHTLAFP
jgi:hypothetical protein